VAEGRINKGERGSGAGGKMGDRGRGGRGGGGRGGGRGEEKRRGGGETGNDGDRVELWAGGWLEAESEKLNQEVEANEVE